MLIVLLLVIAIALWLIQLIFDAILLALVVVWWLFGLKAMLFTGVVLFVIGCVYYAKS